MSFKIFRIPDRKLAKRKGIGPYAFSPCSCGCTHGYGIGFLFLLFGVRLQFGG